MEFVNLKDYITPQQEKEYYIVTTYINTILLKKTLMSLKTKHPDIPKDNPFLNCKLDRKKYADTLTQIIGLHTDGFVLALNNKWGTGKTTFINMWQAQLEMAGYKTINFNAWENDFENNPLTALMGELRKLAETTDEKTDYKNLLSKGAVLLKNVAPVIVKAALSKYFDFDKLDDLKIFVESATKGLTEIFEKDVNDYVQRKESIKDFKIELEKFIKETTNGKPLVFIIDELDRCRPDYAVSVLEQIKHFFSVESIVFVLSIDKEQLGNAVRGVYNSESIDANEYLRRFIDIEYSIPAPNTELFVKYLYELYDFKAFFQRPERLSNYNFDDEPQLFKNISIILFKAQNLSLRQQQKIFVHMRLALRSMGPNNYLFPALFLFLGYIKSVEPQFYNDISNKTLSIPQLQIRLKDLLDVNNIEIHVINVYFLEAYLVYFYYAYLDRPNSEWPPLITGNGNSTLSYNLYLRRILRRLLTYFVR